MKYLNCYKLFESVYDIDEIINTLKDISLDIEDQNFIVDIRVISTFIIVKITHEKYVYQYTQEEKAVKEIDDNLIESIKRMIDYMYSISWDIGTDKWVSDSEGKLRILRHGGYYKIKPSELSEFIGVDFNLIELAFVRII